MATGRFPRVPAIAVFSAARLGPEGRYVNAGDELLTRRLVGWLRASRSDVEVSRTLGGSGARSSTDADRPDAATTFDPRDLRASVAAIRRADLVVLGGGTLLQSDAPDSIIPQGMARYVSTVSWLCRALRTPYVLVGVGVELPPPGWSRRRLVAVARHASRCLVREAQAAQELDGEGVASEVVGDVYLAPSSATSPPDPEAEPRRTDRPYGVISPRYDARPEELADLVGIASERSEVDHWYLLAMHRSPGADDLAAATALSRSLEAGRWTIVDGTAHPEAVPPLLAAAELCVAMRLHAAYVALDEGTPLLLVGDRDKVRRLASELTAAETDAGPLAAAQAWARAGRARLEHALRTEVVGALPAATVVA